MTCSYLVYGQQWRLYNWRVSSENKAGQCQQIVVLRIQSLSVQDSKCNNLEEHVYQIIQIEGTR